MNFLPELLTVALIHLLAVMSPGPDFVLISRNSLIHSRRAGIFSAVGLGLGILIHAAYTLIGISLLISKSLVLFSIIKFVGAAYLIYIGYKCLQSKPQSTSQKLTNQPEKKLTDLQALQMGFLTNVLNPKVSLFFLALFTQIVSTQTPKYIQAVYGLEMSLATIVWFSLVAIILSHKLIKDRFVKVQHYFERAFGLILIALGLKVAFATSK